MIQCKLLVSVIDEEENELRLQKKVLLPGIPPIGAYVQDREVERIEMWDGESVVTVWLTDESPRASWTFKSHEDSTPPPRWWERLLTHWEKMGWTLLYAEGEAKELEHRAVDLD